MADAFDADLIMKWLRDNPSSRPSLYSGEPLDRLLGKALEEPRLVGARRAPVVRRAAARRRPPAHRAGA